MQDDIVHIVVVDENELIQYGFNKIINGRKSLKKVGGLKNLFNVVNYIGSLSIKPNVLLIDIFKMEGINSFEVASTVKIKFPEIKIIGMTFSEDFFLITKMFRSGADGFFLKSSTNDDIVKTIQATINEEIYFSLPLVKLIHEGYSSYRNEKAGVRLTDRQYKVFDLIGSGCGNKEIAVLLHVNETAINYDVGILKERFGLKTIHDLRKVAIMLKIDGEFIPNSTVLPMEHF